MPATYLQRYIAELQDRAPIQAQSTMQFWLDRGFSYPVQETVNGSRGIYCLSSLCWTIILAVWWFESKKTEQN